MCSLVFITVKLYHNWTSFFLMKLKRLWPKYLLVAPFFLSSPIFWPLWRGMRMIFYCKLYLLGIKVLMKVWQAYVLVEKKKHKLKRHAMKIIQFIVLYHHWLIIQSFKSNRDNFNDFSNKNKYIFYFTVETVILF